MDDTTELAALREEVAALRADLTAMQPIPPDRDPISRRGLLMGLAGAGAAGVATMAGASPAGAATNDFLVLGQANASGQGTELYTTSTDGDILSLSGGAMGVSISSSAAGLDVGTGGGGLGFFGIRVRAQGGTPGVITQSDTGAALILAATDRVGPPPSPAAPTGSISVDENGDTWICVDGNEMVDVPKTWTRLLREDTAAGRVLPIAPLRALDTRATGGRPAGSPAVPGQKAGPLTGGTSLTLDLAGIGTIPASATGVVGNLTVVSPTYNGYLGTRPSGTPNTTSSINFTTGATVANAFTSGLGDVGLTITGSGTAAHSYHLIVDITAYLT